MGIVMSEYETKWTGRYPSLCHGEWSLYKDGKKLNVYIPFQNNDASTYGLYQSWHFEDWLEVFESYEDGLNAEQWIEEYQDWLESFAPEEDWEDIYYAFQMNDFRMGSCGGCV